MSTGGDGKDSGTLQTFPTFRGLHSHKGRVVIAAVADSIILCYLRFSRRIVVNKMLSLSNGYVTMSIPLYSCRRCFNHNLTPLMYIRYRLDSKKLTLDIGNPNVAEKYLSFLNTELSNIKRNFEGRTEKVEFTIRGTNETFSVPPGMVRPIIDELGVQEVRKVSPGDADF